MDLSRAFDAIDRTILWAAIYKKGIPIEMILHIRRGRQKTKPTTKTHGQYGETMCNNVGLFQGSAISALLFIIYCGDVMEDYAALTPQTPIHMRRTQSRAPETQGSNLHGNLKQQYSYGGKISQEEWVRNMTRKMLDAPK